MKAKGKCKKCRSILKDRVMKIRQFPLANNYHSFIHPAHLLSTYYVPATVLGVQNVCSI